MRGRKPIPSRLHELRGDPGKRHRSRDGEPRPNVLEKVGPVPSHLNDLAKAEYRRIMKEQVGLRMIDRRPIAHRWLLTVQPMRPTSKATSV